MSRFLKFSLVLFLFLFVSPANAFASASLALSPSSANPNKSCGFTVDVNLDTGGQATAGTDVILKFDPSQFNVNSIDTAGKVYSDYPSHSSDNTNGTINISGLASVDTPFSGTGKFATVNFTVNPSASTGIVTQVKFDFDPNNRQKTTDSNVVQSGTVEDILGSVTDGVYTIGSNPCSSSSAAPTSAPPPGGGGTIIYVTPPPAGGGTTIIGTSKGGVQATGTAQQAYLNQPPPGSATTTIILAVAGSFFVIAGILGLALL